MPAAPSTLQPALLAQLGLTIYFITGCGYVTAVPVSWTAAWKDTSQPFAIVSTGGEAAVISVPTLQGSGYHTFEVIKP